MRKDVATLSALVLFGIAGLPQQASKPVQADKPAQQTEKPAAQADKPAAATAAFVIPPDVAKQANPVKPTAASIANGKQMYGYDCAMCHGADGSGKGDLAADMKLNLKDYRDAAALKDMTDGEIFYIIQKGKGDMTGEGDRQKPEGIWNMVNYIRSLSKKTPPAKVKPTG
ncbi:MAG: cytochrome c [Candidatus Acidiferrales bacterium]|jgi:mono/diheme cytochrome c family protein|nr:cytochrome c [Candidatus Acidoferrales bacterium]